MAIPTTTDVLQGFARRFPGRTVPLGQVLAALDDRGIAAAMLLLTLPQLLPLPLGVSNLLALPIVAVAAQMAIGRNTPWLPSWLRERRIERTTLQRACRFAERPLRRIEQMVHPRLEAFCARSGNRAIGVACLAIALVCLAPLPFTGWLPAWALAVIGIGILERDGLVVLAGLVLGTVALAVFAAVVVSIGEMADLASSAGIGIR